VALSDILTILGIAIDGGKDSLSMAAQVSDSSGRTETVKSPGTLVLSAYATCPDITRVITPDIKKPGQSRLMFIDLGNGKNRLGGSALAHVYKQPGGETPDVEDVDLLKRAFQAIQLLISQDLIVAGHDRSDGGIITTLLEMTFAGNCGLDVNLIQDSGFKTKDDSNAIEILFSEEIGLVMEYQPEKEDEICNVLQKESIPFQVIGKTTSDERIIMHVNDSVVLNEDMKVLRDIWEETSYQIERIQATPLCADEEKKNNYDRRGPAYTITFTPDEMQLNDEGRPGVAIVREEGSNSDREMTSAFYQAGFEPWDITMTDFLEDRISLKNFKGMVFVGGFSYADVLDSAKGWAGVIRFNKKIWEEFQDFYNRRDTFSLGVCNGCQLMALLGWVPWQGIEHELQPRFIQNTSGRFESRFSSVKILKSPSLMLKGMEGSVLGIWVAHGEGRAFFPGEEVYKRIEEKNLAPIRYVDDDNDITMKYPFNPNGSFQGVAGLCSPDGRHLAIMPHPERTFLTWQWPWLPDDWRGKLKTSPWLKMFQNARQWCG
jgi:phosphoribosylformylglycinamidine synthase